MEICNLIGWLPPAQRLIYFAWVCSQAELPGTFGLHPDIGELTVKLAREAQHCDTANEQLTIDILQSLSHMWIDWQLDTAKCLDALVYMVRGKSACPVPVEYPRAVKVILGR